MLNILIIDNKIPDSDIIASAFNAQNDINIVSTTPSLESALGLLKRSHPDKYEIDIIIVNTDEYQNDLLRILPEFSKSSPDTRLIVILPLGADSTKHGKSLLASGADDYIVKPDMKKGSGVSEFFKTEIIEKTLFLGSTKTNNDKTDSITLRPAPPAFLPDVIAIASSTGGPSVVTKILAGLKNKKISMPIFITQHMPKDFTALMATQISNASGLNCIEAKNETIVEKGNVYIAPGNYHMQIKKKLGDPVIVLDQGPEENFCRPAADPMLRSIVKTYGANKVLAIVLTGMGKDGLEGCKLVAENGGVVIAQNRETSTVWGMPGAVANAQICSSLLSPEGIVEEIIHLSAGKIA